MRFWIIFSSVVILLFCVPGLVLTMFAPGWGDFLVYLLLNALAVHAIYYCKVARSEPVSGYRHLAANQLLLGIVCGALLVRLGYMLANPEVWDMAYQEMLALMQQLFHQQASPTQIEQMLHEVMDPWRRLIELAPLWVALLTVLSQAFFAWLLYRRARPAAQGEPKP